ncbi:MAG: MotA/TolQ/ExbB proton channel family protein [Spirochaetes bacterium]|nr:MotA/TolQ/ExbB proton channel family protein [Spirochaetota bacterium]
MKKFVTLIFLFFPVILLGAERSSTSLWDLFKMGGIWMWFLLALSVLSLWLILEKLYIFHRKKLNTRFFFPQFETLLKKNNFDKIEDFFFRSDHLVCKVLNKGFRKKISMAEFEGRVERAVTIEVNELGNGLNILATIGSVAPLIGFLGTVAGMIRAFGNIAAADEVSAQLVAGGIYTALTTTAYGLIIAIPTIALYNFFIHKIDSFVSDTEKTVNLILNNDLIK